MPHPARPSPRPYPEGWDLDIYFTDTGPDGLPYVGFLRMETALSASRQAEERTGVPMEVIALQPFGYGYRPAQTQGVA